MMQTTALLLRRRTRRRTMAGSYSSIRQLPGWFDVGVEVEEVVRVVSTFDLGEPRVRVRAVGGADAVLVELDHGVDVRADAIGVRLHRLPERAHPVALGGQLFARL